MPKMFMYKMATYPTQTMFLGCCYLTDKEKILYLDCLFPHKDMVVVLEVNKYGKANKRIELNIKEFRKNLQNKTYKLISNLKPNYTVDLTTGKRVIIMDYI